MKNTLIKSTIILVIGGIITKILSMVIRIVLSRLLKDSLGIYMIILPTFSLLISLTSLGLPTAISKLVSENSRNNKNLIFSIVPITLLFDILVIIIVIILSDFISVKLLHDPSYKYMVISMGLVLPFIDISSILRGYFFGKQKMVPHVISNIMEDIVRLILLLIGVPYFLKININITIIYIILINILCEITSILIMFLFLPKKIIITKKDFKLNIKDILDTFKIGIPTTISRLIGNIGYFLEPIIITNVLLKLGYMNSYITFEYGIINGYVLPIVLLPSFFTYAISSSLLPIISKAYQNKDYKTIKKKINQSIIYSLIIGIPYTIFIMIFPNILLNILYHTNYGINYLLILAPISIMHYVQAPLTSSMQAMNLSKEAMYGTLLATIVRCLMIYLTSYLKIGLYPIIIGLMFNILIVTIQHIIIIKKHL